MECLRACKFIVSSCHHRACQENERINGFAVVRTKHPPLDLWALLTFIGVDFQVELVSAERACATIDELTHKPVYWVATGVDAIVLRRHAEDAILAVHLSVDQASRLEDGPHEVVCDDTLRHHVL